MLLPIAGIYSLVIILRELAIDSGYLPCRRLAAPVISVGNITAGGTGKTPAVVWIVEKLQATAQSLPVILSRGYGHDEVQLLQALLPHTPHFTHKRRFHAGCQALTACGPNVCFVLDDGFQHRKLCRDLDIVLIDALQPFGFEHMLPRGLLREPISHLRRADVIIITKCNMVEHQFVVHLQQQLQKMFPRAIYAQAVHTPTRVRQLGHNPNKAIALQNKRCLPFAGIGNPQSFVRIVEQLGAVVVDHHYFADHHQYIPKDLRKLHSKALKLEIECMVTTAKDAVKVQKLQLPSLPILVVDIELEIQEGENLLLTALRKPLLEK